MDSAMTISHCCENERYDLPGEHSIIGNTEEIVQLRRKINRVADIKRTTLILGDTGTGKELVAKQLHTQSSLCKKPFVTVHCGAIQDSLVESEFFGHRRGAFTGANDHHEGLVTVADGGVLFLDEVNSLSPAGQSKLLRFLETGEYRPVGANSTRKADVWVISASNQDLYSKAQTGAFRLDLLYRLDMIRINVPPLCLRKQDILLLADHFLQRIAGTGSYFTHDAIKALAEWTWPGNVRELKHRIEAASLLSDNKAINAQDLGFDIPFTELVPKNNERQPSQSLASQLWKLVEANGMTLGETLSLCEELLIQQALHKESDNRTRAAARLGIHVRTIFKKLQRDLPQVAQESYHHHDSISSASSYLLSGLASHGEHPTFTFN